MQNMERTRIVFAVIVGLALLIVCSAVAYSAISRMITTAHATATPISSVTGQPTPAVHLE